MILIGFLKSLRIALFLSYYLMNTLSISLRHNANKQLTDELENLYNALTNDKLKSLNGNYTNEYKKIINSIQ